MSVKPVATMAVKEPAAGVVPPIADGAAQLIWAFGITPFQVNAKVPDALKLEGET